MPDQEQFLRYAMDAYGSAVYRLALCRLQNVQDAEDVYQDVFLRLLKEKRREWDGEQLKAWLLRVALNRCADIRRFRLRRPVLALDEVPELAGPVDSEGAELWEAVARLHYAEGYQTEEIAAMLGIPAATVRTRLRRGRIALKNSLGGYDNGEQVSEFDEQYSSARQTY